MASLFVVKLELNKGANNMGFGRWEGINKAIRRVTPEESASSAAKTSTIANDGKGLGHKQLKIDRQKAVFATIPAIKPQPAMRYAPLDLSDTGRPPLNLKNKKALNPSLQAPMTLYDRQMLKGK